MPCVRLVVGAAVLGKHCKVYADRWSEFCAHHGLRDARSTCPILLRPTPLVRSTSFCTIIIPPCNSLNRYGCRVFLRALARFAAVPPPCSLLDGYRRVPLLYTLSYFRVPFLLPHVFHPFSGPPGSRRRSDLCRGGFLVIFHPAHLCLLLHVAMCRARHHVPKVHDSSAVWC